MAKNQPKQPRKGARKPARASVSADRPDIVHTSLYLPKPLHQALREIAFKKDCKIHDLVIEGIETVVQRHRDGDGRKAR